MRSALVIHELATGGETTVLETSRLIEAPNWYPDGSALLVNGDGLLYRVPLERPALQLVDTGHHCALNNDHGISPDGKTLVISDKTDTDDSCIYLLPVAGGVPSRITPHVPSWWHGWSPDGSTLAYTARRDGSFDIYTMPVSGGAERRITQGGGHHDGPDYTADGAWIWFNSDTGGQMALWRIRTDGSDRQCMTDDDRVNWFPHPSPCGAHVLYLSYLPGTQFHPRDRDVELRLMPATGGAARVLVAFFGGQGSINVPCWHPDGTCFAYMRYWPES